MLSRREKLREATTAEIKAIARQQMSEQGAAALSLRAIAAQMGITAPALYGYFKSRDELVTALLVDAYHDLAHSLQVVGTQYAANPTRAVLEVMLAYRAWAVANPADFSLLFGTPIPGYMAPEDLTIPAAHEGMNFIMLTLQKAYESRSPELPITSGYSDLAPSSTERLEKWLKSKPNGVDLVVAHTTLVGWSLAQGLITLEIFGHLRFILEDPAEFYRNEIMQLLKRLGIVPQL